MASVRYQGTHSIPAELPVPTEVLALPEVFSLVEKANLPALAVALQLTDLFDEVHILDRLAYKNKNQHRASKHHQAVCQVLKVLQLFQQLQLPALMQALHTAAERTALPEAPATTGSSKRTKRQQQPKQSAAAQRQAVRLPSYQAGCFVLRRLLSGAQLLLDLHHVILTAGQHLSGQLSRGYFMPFCLVAAATVSRIRVLATTALLELLQAYNGLVQLLPLLPMVTPGGIASGQGSSSGSSGSGVLSVGSEGLPQMLQLTWNGPIPALRGIPFDAQGPQSLQGLAAELQQTYLISSSSDGAYAGVEGVSGVPAGALQQDVLQHALSGPSTVQQGGGVAGDVGVAVSREAFAQQSGQQQHQAAARERPQRRTKQQKQQQQQQPVVAISFFEDKQPEKGAPGSDAPGPATDTQQAADAAAAAAVAVPLYTTVPGLGFSLGTSHKPGPTLPVLLWQTAPTAAVSALGLPGPVAAQAGGAGGITVPGSYETTTAATAAAAAAAGVQAMDIDTVAAADQEEFAQLYGRQPTPTQPAPLARQPQAQAQQQQHWLVGQPGISGNTSALPSAAVSGAGLGAGVRRGLQAPAAFLAMQGTHSSDDDEDMQPAEAAGAAAGAAAEAAVSHAQFQLQQASSIPQQALVQQQQLLQQQQAAAPAPAPSEANVKAADMPAQAGGTAGTGATVPGNQAAQAEQAAPLLQVSKKMRVKKKGNAKAAAGGKDAAAGVDEAPRDSILDMLLQGL